ncbi:MAG: hypothetical protein J6K23_04110 [Bacilli bacterium]|nr:hypothetical protein [Bacilli bacterium]
MNKNKINLMIEEKRKEKTKVQNKILYYQKNLRNQKILNKINPLNCSFILTAIISLLLPFNFFLTFKSSIITYLIVGILSYEFQKNILRKIYSHKNNHIKNQLNSLISYNKEVCKDKLIDSELELLKKKYDNDNGMPKFNIEHYFSFSNNVLDIEKYEDVINNSIDNINEASKKKSILEIKKEYSLKNIIKKLLISSPLIVLFTILSSLYYNLLSIPPMLTCLIGSSLLSINLINQINNYVNARKVLNEYNDLTKTNNISENITDLNNEIDINIKNIYINRQYEFDVELLKSILEIDYLDKENSHNYEENNEKITYTTMPKLKIYKK